MKEGFYGRERGRNDVNMWLTYEILKTKKYINYIKIQYKNQIKFGEIVKCKYAKENGENIVTIKSEDEKVLHAIIKIY